MHSSMNITLIHCACNYSVSTLRINLSSVLLLLRISKPHLVQAGLSTKVANHTHAWTHTCKNGGYCYFKHLCPVVMSYSNPVLEYWHKYPTLKLSSISHSGALILVHIIMNNLKALIVHVLLLQAPQIDSYCICAGDVRSK